MSTNAAPSAATWARQAASRSSTRAQPISRRETAGVRLIACEATRDGDIDAAVAEATREGRDVDVVVANAGFGVAGALQKLTPEDCIRSEAARVEALRVADVQQIRVGRVAHRLPHAPRGLCRPSHRSSASRRALMSPEILAESSLRCAANKPPRRPYSGGNGRTAAHTDALCLCNSIVRQQALDRPRDSYYVRALNAKTGLPDARKTLV